MAIICPKCGAAYDVTLFEFERGIVCDCGQWVDLAAGHRQVDEGSKQASKPAKMSPLDQKREEEVKLLAAIKDALPKLEEYGLR